MLVPEFGKKVELFHTMWKDGLITDTEFVDNIRVLSTEVDLVANAVKNHTERQDGLQDTGHIDAGPYWHG